MKTFTFILKYLMLIAMALIVSVLLSNYKKIIPVYTENLKIYVFGFFIYTLLYLSVLKRKYNFYGVLMHELTHFLFALITFKKISVLHITTDSGLVQYEGEKNFLISLSPYFFPLVTILIISISNIIPNGYTTYCNMFIIISYASFLFSLFRNFSIRNADILECGLFFSVLFIGLINFITLIFIIHLISKDISGFIALFNNTNLLKIL